MELVSIIVPVYNVEKYLKECIESIINQSFSNLEIILVDDGSTDESGNICDDFLNKDKRIKVFHKTNGGLSDARNYGINNSSGKYITFVDSDDLISPIFIDVLYNAIKQYDTHLSICGFQRFKDNDNLYITNKSSNIKCFFDNNGNILENILYQKKQNIYSIASCGKMYHRDIFKTIRFPINKLNEDMAIIMEVIRLNKKISVVEENLYFYRINPSSITMQKFTPKRMDVINVSEKILLDTKEYFPHLIDAAEVLLFSRSFEMLTIAYYTSSTNEYINEKKRLENIIKKYRKKVLYNYHARIQARIAAFISLFSIHFTLFILNQLRAKRYK